MARGGTAPRISLKAAVNKQHAAVKQAAKKKRQRRSKDRSEHVRDALNRDADLVYDVLKKAPTTPSAISQSDPAVSLAEGMQKLGGYSVDRDA